MRQTNAYIVGFAAAVCVVASLLLAVVSGALAEPQERARVLDRQKNVLRAAGYGDAELRAMGPAKVQELYKSSIEELVIDEQGKVLEGVTQQQLSKKEATLEERKGRLPLFRFKDPASPTETKAYIFPVVGKGLWSTLYGYLAVKPDGDEIVGIAFYKHGETPGLGAEIEREWFAGNFKGKKLYDDGKLVGVQVVKGKVADKTGIDLDHAVDGISGSTLTGNGVTKLMRTVPSYYKPFFQKQRAQQTALFVPEVAR